MGKPGPPPTPTALRVLRGNPQRRPLNKREPEPNASRPACPRWLDVEAKREWARVVPALHKIGLLRSVDRAALAGYCSQWSRLVRAEAYTRDHGDVMTRDREDAYGNKWIEHTASPSVAIADRCVQRIRMFCQEFGLTASARSRMQLPGEVAAPDEFDRLMEA